MRAIILIVASIMLTVVLGIRSPCHAQGKRYRSPSRSTLPPQLNYFRDDVGALDSYNTFVKPQQQLQKQLQSIERAQDLNRRAIDDTRETIDAEGSPTGTHATFRNFSHFYPALRSTGASAGTSRGSQSQKHNSSRSAVSNLKGSKSSAIGRTSASRGR